MNEIKVEVIDHDDRTWKQKLKDKVLEFKYDLKTWWAETSVWIVNHWFDVAKVLVVMLPIATQAVKFIRTCHGSAADLREQRMQNCYYDPSTGAHWRLKRDLTNAEQSELLSRQRRGELAEDILRDMRVLKK